MLKPHESPPSGARHLRVMAFAVAQRTHEIVLRIALGAGRGRVVQQVLRDGMKTAILGTLIGSVGAYFVARSMRGMVPGVGPDDPTAFIIVVATLIGAALVACLVPASRAASVDPMTAQFGDESPDSLAGGHTKAGVITGKG